MTSAGGRTGRMRHGGPRRGSRAAASLVTIYWRDIPAQVTATSADDRVKQLLPARFQHAIDRAAAVAGLTETHAYVAQWRREATDLEGDAATAARQEAERLDRAYPKRRLDELVHQGGLDHPPRPAPDSGGSG